MLIYNITIKADLDAHLDLVDWIRESQLPAAGDYLLKPSRLYRLLNVDTSDGITYCLQHHFADMAAYNRYMAGHDTAFREELSGRFPDKLVVFSSILSEV